LESWHNSYDVINDEDTLIIIKLAVLNKVEYLNHNKA